MSNSLTSLSIYANLTTAHFIEYIYKLCDLIKFYGGIIMKGTVKWFNNQKGYGFISDAEGHDVFVHYSGLNMEGFKTLEEGQEVEYEVTEGAKGPQAVNVTPL